MGDITFSFVFTAMRLDSVKNRLLQGLDSPSGDGWSIGDHSFEFNPHSQYVIVRPTPGQSPRNINLPIMIPYSTFRKLLDGDVSCRDGIRYL